MGLDAAAREGRRRACGGRLTGGDGSWSSSNPPSCSRPGRGPRPPARPARRCATAVPRLKTYTIAGGAAEASIARFSSPHGLSGRASWLLFSRSARSNGAGRVRLDERSSSASSASRSSSAGTLGAAVVRRPDRRPHRPARGDPGVGDPSPSSRWSRSPSCRWARARALRHARPRRRRGWASTRRRRRRSSSGSASSSARSPGRCRPPRARCSRASRPRRTPGAISACSLCRASSPPSSGRSWWPCSPASSTPRRPARRC